MKVQHHGSDPNTNTCPKTQASWHMQIIRNGHLTPFKLPCRRQSLLVNGFCSWGKCKERRANEFNSKDNEIYLLLWLIVLHYLLYSKFHRECVKRKPEWGVPSFSTSTFFQSHWGDNQVVSFSSHICKWSGPAYTRTVRYSTDQIWSSCTG